MLDEMQESWIQTYSGKKFNPLHPYLTPNGFSIIDVAHALSMQCRYSGHTRRHYSVGEHAVRVAAIMEVIDPKNTPWGLNHDDPEAYLVDLATPIKRMLPEYKKSENNLMDFICDQIGLDRKEPPSVKIADKFMLAVESRDLMGPLIPGWGRKCFEGTVEEWIKRNNLEELWKDHQYNLLDSNWTPKDADRTFMTSFIRLFPEYSDRHGLKKNES